MGEAGLSGLCWPQVEVHHGRREVSPAKRSEAVAAWCALSKGEDREEKQRNGRSGERTRRRGQCCLDEGPEPPGVRKAGFRWPLAAHWEAAFRVPEVPRAPPQKGMSHTLGAINLIPTRVLGLAHPIEID